MLGRILHSFSRQPQSVRAFATKTQAAIAKGAKEPFVLETVTLRDPRPDEVRVRIVATGICHTDIAVKERGLSDFPVVLGHEGAGVVEAVGAEVSNGVKVGDHVIMSYASCGSCKHCAIGKPAYCFDHGAANFGGRLLDGTTAHTGSNNETIYGSFFRQSSFALHALAGRSNVIAVPREASLPMMAPLGCGVQTGAGAVMNTLRCPAGSSLVVFGCGAVGLSAIMAARVVGCSRIIAVDLVQSRLDLATELGATHGIQLKGGESSAEVARRVKELCPGGVDFSLDTSGNKHALRSAFDSLKPMGVCGLIGGAAPGVEVSVEMLNLLNGKQLRGIIQGDSVPQTFIPDLIQLHQQGRFPFDKMITYYDGGLADLNRAIEDTRSGKTIKPVLRIADP